jgi:tetratricopeptide (TPR) repeat protein
MPSHLRLWLTFALISSTASAPAAPRGDAALIQLLQTQGCRQCQLAEVNLVHAQLQDADLEGAKLQRANLSQARLDGANLRGADLSFTSLHGASLRGANLQGAKLVGTDLREVDLTDARFDPNALEQAHWSGAIALQATTQSYAALHNSGVVASESDRWSDAEELFGLAILQQPQSAESWVARGIARERLGKRPLAIQDFSYASRLYAENGANEAAEQLTIAAVSLQDKTGKKPSGNGAGSAALNGLLSTSQTLLPIAMKLFLPALGL